MIILDMPINLFRVPLPHFRQRLTKSQLVLQEVRLRVVDAALSAITYLLK